MKFEKSRLKPLQLELGGIKYPVRVTFNAMADFEERFGIPYAEIIPKITGQDLNIKDLQFVLFTLLKNGGVEVALEDLNSVDFTLDILDVMADALLKANKVFPLLEALTDQAEQESGKSKKKNKTA